MPRARDVPRVEAEAPMYLHLIGSRSGTHSAAPEAGGGRRRHGRVSSGSASARVLNELRAARARVRSRRVLRVRVPGTADQRYGRAVRAHNVMAHARRSRIPHFFRASNRTAYYMSERDVLAAIREQEASGAVVTDGVPLARRSRTPLPLRLRPPLRPAIPLFPFPEADQHRAVGAPRPRRRHDLPAQRRPLRTSACSRSSREPTHRRVARARGGLRGVGAACRTPSCRPSRSRSATRTPQEARRTRRMRSSSANGRPAEEGPTLVGKAYVHADRRRARPLPRRRVRRRPQHARRAPGPPRAAGPALGATSRSWTGARRGAVPQAWSADRRALLFAQPTAPERARRADLRVERVPSARCGA
jgi:hypothetical protein